MKERFAAKRGISLAPAVEHHLSTAKPAVFSLELYPAFQILSGKLQMMLDDAMQYLPKQLQRDYHINNDTRKIEMNQVYLRKFIHKKMPDAEPKIPSHVRHHRGGKTDFSGHPMARKLGARC
jgi:hypothetical protein